MARSLIQIYIYFKRNPTERWCHVSECLIKTQRNSSVAGGDAIKLRYWGLIESKDGVRDDGSPRVGLHAITDLGRDFAVGLASVPKFVYLYNQQLIGVGATDRVTIHEALTNKFSYEDLMTQ